MLIVADENIPLVREAFSRLGEVRLVAGRSLRREDVRDAGILLVRSVTHVNEALLAGSRVRFVGTATIGLDHVDREYLERAGIAFASAQGSNADSVVQYVLAALAEVARRTGIALEGRTLGIVGVGNIGSRLARVAPALGLRVMTNDPPRQRAGDAGDWHTLEELLDAADFVSLHVPLNRGGIDNTRHLIGAEQLRRMRRDAILINTSRGAIVDNRALLEALGGGLIAGAVLDVFEGEPNPDWELIRAALLATAHIAGYSMEGKTNGTRMMHEAVCRFLGEASTWQPSLGEPESPLIDLQGDTASPEGALARAILHTYSIAADDRTLREALDLPVSERAGWFDHLRRNYPLRREFPAYAVRLAEGDPLAGRLRQFGFHISGA